MILRSELAMAGAGEAGQGLAQHGSALPRSCHDNCGARLAPVGGRCTQRCHGLTSREVALWGLRGQRVGRQHTRGRHGAAPGVRGAHSRKQQW